MVKQGVVYIVATPIGHLGDLTERAVSVLKEVDYILVEDTRHSLPLLKRLGILKPLIALHDHNEKNKAEALVLEVQKGVTFALISDAGTPLICDPGYYFVRLLHQHGIKVIPIPGPCSIITALSVSGLPTDRFVFEGFLQAKATARRTQLQQLVDESRTLIFFEVPHRILSSLQTLIDVFGGEREALVARELTKMFESIFLGTLATQLDRIRTDPNQQKGEFVLVIAGAIPKSIEAGLTVEHEHILKVLLTALPLKQAVTLAAKITGIGRNLLYERALKFSA